MISVILPVYNGQRYLKSSILSVLSQSGVEFEVVIVDDASVDESPRIIESLTGDVEHVKCWTNEANHGLFYTLNKAVELCSFSLIKVWAQDDVMKPGCLASFAKVMTDNRNSGFFWCRSEAIDENWDWDDQVRNSAHLNDCDVKAVSSENWSISKSIGHFFWCGNLHGNISLMAFHRTEFERVGGFNEDFRYSGDIDITARILNTKSPTCIDSELVWLRNHSGQLSRSSSHLHKELMETTRVFNFLLESHSKILSNTDLGRFCRNSYAHRSLPYFVSNSLLVMSEMKLKQGFKMLWTLNPGWGMAHSIWFWVSRRFFGKTGPALEEMPGLTKVEHFMI